MAVLEALVETTSGKEPQRESQNNIETFKGVWNHIQPVRIGAELTEAGTVSFDIPPTVPPTAKEVISYTTTCCFNRVSNRRSVHHIKLYTKNGSGTSHEKNIRLTTSFLDVESNTIMFPVEADRQIHMDLDKASDSCWIDIHIPGYR